MNRIFKIAFIFSTAALMHSAFAAQTNMFYVGLSAGAVNQIQQYNNYDYFTGTTNPGATLTYNYTKLFNNSVSSPSFVGTAMLGYSEHVKKKFNLDYEFDVSSNAGTTAETDNMQSPLSYSTVAMQEYTAQTTVNFPYTFDFVVKPALHITKKLSGYIKGGASYANMNTIFTLTKNNSMLPEQFSVTNGNINMNIWGYVVGTGLEFAVTKRFSVFSEYNFHQYSSTTLKGVTITDNGTATGTSGVTNNTTINYYRIILPYFSSINFGVHYYF